MNATDLELFGEPMNDEDRRRQARRGLYMLASLLKMTGGHALDLHAALTPPFVEAHAAVPDLARCITVLDQLAHWAWQQAETAAEVQT